jgi:antitoxin (DNA-binding transcriptional repressor) of toxin-antitoxin stability system
VAIDVNNPMEFHPQETITLRDFATSPPEAVIDELLATGNQTLITRQGRIVALLEPISQDERTQADLAVRYGNMQAGIVTPNSASAPHESLANEDKLKLVQQLVEQARKAAELGERQ